MTEFTETACAAARAAGEMLRYRFRSKSPLKVSTKGLHDFVTEVDHEAEAIVVSRIKERFPDHVIMAEEGSPDATSDDYRWIVDPLDGTTNFIHGVPVFAVSVAVEDTRGLLAGAIYDPLRDEMFRASRGAGAWLNDEAISCTTVHNMSDALIATGFPFRQLARLEQYLAVFAAFVSTAAGMRRAGSAVLDLAYTACGRYDGFWEIGLNRWDVAAGALLVREAGGVVADLKGGGGFLGGDIVAAGPGIHASMLSITKKTFV